MQGWLCCSPDPVLPQSLVARALAQHLRWHVQCLPPTGRHLRASGNISSNRCSMLADLAGLRSRPMSDAAETIIGQEHQAATAGCYTSAVDWGDERNLTSLKQTSLRSQQANLPCPLRPCKLPAARISGGFRTTTTVSQAHADVSWPSMLNSVPWLGSLGRATRCASPVTTMTCAKMVSETAQSQPVSPARLWVAADVRHEPENHPLWASEVLPDHYEVHA